MSNRLHLGGNTVPAQRLKTDTRHPVGEVESGDRKVITRDGVAIAVLVGAEEFERLQKEASIGRLLSEMRHAEAEIEAGGGISQAQLERSLEARWGA